MSVYIPGMEMPKNCCECPLCFFRYCFAMDTELTEEETMPHAERPKICPIVFIPPHGDLIDRDKAIAERNAFGNWAYDLSDLPDYLNGLPTIIPADKEAEP